MPFKEANVATGFRSPCTHIVAVYVSTDNKIVNGGQTNQFISNFKSIVSYKSVAYRIKLAIFNEVKLSSISNNNMFFNITGQDRSTKSYAFKLCPSPSVRTQQKQTNKQTNTSLKAIIKSATARF